MISLLLAFLFPQLNNLRVFVLTIRYLYNTIRKLYMKILFLHNKCTVATNVTIKILRKVTLFTGKN